MEGGRGSSAAIDRAFSAEARNGVRLLLAEVLIVEVVADRVDRVCRGRGGVHVYMGTDCSEARHL